MSLHRLFAPAATALCIAFASHPAAAQSQSAAAPTPLGPGVNKGNIDNSVPGHFYYFYLGPGHIDVAMRFHEMGVFGNPFRQSLNFDYYSEDGQLVSHNVVTSQGNLAELRNSGDRTTRKKFIVKITTQPGAIRLGGYYEIEATGAVGFDGPTVGAKVKPGLSESLVHPGGSLVNPVGPLVNPPKH